MAIRRNAVASIIRAREGRDEWSELDTAVGHPCGFICYSWWLARHPVASTKVSRFLASDAFSTGGDEWNRWSFAAMLSGMQDSGCTLSYEARKLVKWWVRSGRPMPWADDANRPFLRVEGEFFNGSYEDTCAYRSCLENTNTPLSYCMQYPTAEQRAALLAAPREFFPF